MYIKKLYLNSFGKFQNKEIAFDKNINIVYGLNETGKSTVHKFIEGILFGFFKSYSKKRIYSADHSKYHPWDKNRYGGSLIYSADGEDCRVERDLLKGRDSVRIFNNSTGGEITDKASYNSNLGLPEPASISLGVSGVVYKNTLSVSQLSLKTDKELAGEVREILVNINEGRSEDISVAKVLRSLEDKISGLGTVKAKKTKLGEICSRIDELGKELSKSRINYEEADKLQAEINKLTEEKVGLSYKLKQLVMDIEIIRNEEYKKQLKEGTEIQKQMDDISRKLDELAKYGNVDETKYDIVMEASNTIRNHEKDILDSDNKLAAMNDGKKSVLEQIKVLEIPGDLDLHEVQDLKLDHEKLKNMQDRNNEKINRIENIEAELRKISDINENLSDDYYRFEELEDESLRLVPALDNIVDLEKKSGSLDRRKKIQKMIVFVSAFIILSGLSLGYFISSLLYILSAAAAAALILSIFIYIKTSGKSRQTDLELFREKKSVDERKNDISREMQEILAANKADDPIGLKKKFNSLNPILMRKSDLAEEKGDLGEQIRNASIEIARKEAYIQNILNKVLNAENAEMELENIKKAEERYRRYSELKGRLNSVEEDLIRLKNETDKKREETEKISGKLGKILADSGTQAIEEYKQATLYKKQYIECQKSLSNKQTLISQVLKGNSADSIRNRIKDSLATGTVYDLGLEETIRNKDELAEKLAGSSAGQTRLEEKIAGIERNSRPVVDITSEIDYLESQKQDTENRIKAFEMAKDTIEEISARVRNNFAPKINNKISDMLNYITSGKYDEIKVDSEMGIKLIDKEINRLVDIEDLSAGTIDQVYFALRFAVLDLIKENSSLPLFLDDCFVNYDAERLRGILRYIYEEALSSDRQILLFTCHEREIKMLEEEGLSFNLVKL